MTLILGCAIACGVLLAPAAWLAFHASLALVAGARRLRRGAYRWWCQRAARREVEAMGKAWERGEPPYATDAELCALMLECAIQELPHHLKAAHGAELARAAGAFDDETELGGEG